MGLLQDKESDIRILKQVLFGEIPEDDGKFLDWLSSDSENLKLFKSLKGEAHLRGGYHFNKDKVMSNMEGLLDLNRSGGLFSGKAVQKIAMSVLGVALLAGLFWGVSSLMPGRDQVIVNETHFEPGEKIAYLQSSKGKTVSLSSDFVKENTDGTKVTNNSEGVVKFESNAPIKKKEVEFQTLSVPRGGEYELVLADGTKVYLNSDSRLTFPNSFEDDTRTVKLEGEAYFDVAKNGIPFIVELSGFSIKVLGTKFNVNSYVQNGFSNTTLVEGSVSINIPGQEGGIVLEPSQNLHIDQSSGKTHVSTVDTSLFTAWLHGEFVFRNQRLDDILTQLSRWYNFDIRYERSEIGEKRFSGSAEKHRELSYMLDQIQKVTDVKYRMEDDTIIFY